MPEPRRTPFLEAALGIARQLAGEARRDAGNAVFWDTDEIEGESVADSRIVRARTGHDLYGGSAGIAWFLAHAAPPGETDPLIRSVAEAAMDSALHGARAMVRHGQSALYSGAAGVALAACEAGRRLGNSRLSEAGARLAIEVAEAMLQPDGLPREHDLIGGGAGAVVALLAVHRSHPGQALIEASDLACRRLIGDARREWWGWSWPDPAAAVGLCGLGHGAGGIAWALAEMGWAAGEPRYLEAAREAMRYERGWFSREGCSWPDLRSPEAGAMCAWCHGAIGIGAMRLRVFEVEGGQTALADASAAIYGARGVTMQAGAALARGEPGDVTLCHGLAGAAELFLLAHEILGRDEHLSAARRVGELCLAIHTKNAGQWPVGLRGARHIPGLFLGLAGIGTMLLRLHDPCLAGSPALAGRPIPGSQAKRSSGS
jgi:lantibiotic biosynthesis protein